MTKVERKLNKFIKSLQQSGVLDWIEKLEKEFPESEVYLVGGAVRDAILSPPAFAPRSFNSITLAEKKLLGATAGRLQDIKDLDFVVQKVAMKDLKKVLSRLGWVEEIGKKFGVLKFIPKNMPKDFEPLDIALPRSEFSTGQGGYKDFKVKFDKDLNIEQDLLRRDFTINAIAILLGEGIEVVDPFNGLDDIKKKIIKCVGKSKERLSEDYTRILRAVRFACQLDFEIAPEVKTVIKKLVPHLNDKDKTGEYISPREVIAKELLKALAEDHMQAVELYDELGLFKILMPEILKMKKCPQPKNFHSEGDVWQHTMLALQNIESNRFKRFEGGLDKILVTENTKTHKTQKHNTNNKDGLELIFALLLHDIGKPGTIQTPKKNKTDRIRFNDHDNLGAELTNKICERLKLSAPEKLGIDCENVAWLVRKHMMLVHGHPSELRPNTIEKNFFNDRYPGKNLIKLAWLDISATITNKGPLKPDLVDALLKRIKEMKKLVKNKKARQSLPEPLLDGDEIMKITKLKPSKKVGEIKDKLREKQLGGEIKDKVAARKFVKDNK